MSQASEYIMHVLIHSPGCLFEEVLLELILGAAMFLVLFKMLFHGEQY